MSPEETRELAAFPQELRKLIDAELAAGNTIVEIGHSFPAPPAGAYVRFASKVSTRAHESDDRLSWRARNSSLSSGEFTDDQRFYFVVEPPLPEGEEIEVIPPVADGEEDTEPVIVSAAPQPSGLANVPVPLAQRNHRRQATTAAFSGRVAVEEIPSGVRFRVSIRDGRSPREIRALFEKMLVVPFMPASQPASGEQPGEIPATTPLHVPFTLAARSSVNGVGYVFELRYDVAAARSNVYTLTVESSWSHIDEEHRPYYRSQAQGWFEFWIRPWPAARWKKRPVNVPRRYRERVGEVLEEDQWLNDAPTIRAAILSGMKSGGWYSASDKEGTTRISWTGSRFVKTGEGDHPAYEAFANDDEFLDRLRRFCDLWTDRQPPATARSEVEAWRLVLRLMNTPE